METGVMLNIVKVRWIYDCKRVKMDKRQKETEYGNTDEQTEQTDDNRCNDLSETDRQQHHDQQHTRDGKKMKRSHL